MTDILQRLVDAHLYHGDWKQEWIAEAADEIRKLRLEYEAMTQSRDEWQAMAARRTANLEQYSRRAENDIAELARERDNLRTALAELRNRLSGHPMYAELAEEEEENVGGDTAEFSYLVRVADAALAGEEK